MTTASPVHLAPSRQPASVATANSQGSAASGGKHAASFDLLFALQLGADDGSVLTPGATVAEDPAVEAAAAAVTPEPAMTDPAQLLWNPLADTAPREATASATTTAAAMQTEDSAALKTLSALDGNAARGAKAKEPGAASDDAPAASDTPIDTAPAKPAFAMGTADLQSAVREKPASEKDLKPGSATQVQAANLTQSAPVQAAPAQATVQAPVGSTAFADQMVQQVAVFIDQKQLTAQVQVHPPELGPVDIQIKVNADQVQVDFFATQADTRDAIETAIPRLKEMLAEQGLSLSGSHVGTQDDGSRFAQANQGSAFGFNQPEQRDGSPGARGNGKTDDGSTPAAAAPTLQRLRTPRLVDTFA